MCGKNKVLIIMAMMTTMIHDNKHTCHHTSAHTHLTTVLKYVEICGYVHVRMYTCMCVCVFSEICMSACIFYSFTHVLMDGCWYMCSSSTWHANNNTYILSMHAFTRAQSTISTSEYVRQCEDRARRRRVRCKTLNR